MTAAQNEQRALRAAAAQGKPTKMRTAVVYESRENLILRGECGIILYSRVSEGCAWKINSD